MGQAPTGEGAYATLHRWGEAFGDVLMRLEASSTLGGTAGTAVRYIGTAVRYRWGGWLKLGFLAWCGVVWLKRLPRHPSDSSQ